MTAKLRGEEGAEADEDFGDIVDAIHKDDGPIFGDLDADGKTVKIGSWRQPRKGAKAVDEPLPSSGEEGGDSDEESSRSKQRRKAKEAVEAKEVGTHACIVRQAIWSAQFQMIVLCRVMALETSRSRALSRLVFFVEASLVRARLHVTS
jgi:hypothetical protein